MKLQVTLKHCHRIAELPIIGYAYITTTCSISGALRAVLNSLREAEEITEICN